MTRQDANRYAAPTRDLAVPGIEVAFHRIGVAIITVRGQHDLDRRQALSDAIAGAGPQLNVLVDLSECTFMDSSMAALLVTAADDLKERGGMLSLIIPPKATPIQRVAKLTGLGEAMPIHATRGAAIASVRHNEHVIHIRDLRLRFGDPEVCSAECSCGWTGEAHTGRTAERSARREATLHVDRERRS